MEQVAFRLHVRLIRLITPFKNGRKVVERLMLFCAFASAFSLCWLHTSFVNNAPTKTNCMFLALNQSNHGNLADYDVIQLHITSKDHNNETTGEQEDGSSNAYGQECSIEEANTTTNCSNKHVSVSQRWIYLFSLEKGYLMLARPDQRNRHGIRRLDITIPSDSPCFGSPVVAWILSICVGYDTVVMNWLISIFGGQGYLYNMYSKELFNLNFATEFVSGGGGSGDEDDMDVERERLVVVGGEKNGSKSSDIAGCMKSSNTPVGNVGDEAGNITKGGGNLEEEDVHTLSSLFHRLRSMGGRSRGKLADLSFSALRQFIAFKIGVIFTTIFLFFTTTTLVSFTLRATQERMLKFTYLLQHHISHHLPYATIVFTHVVETLVFVPIMIGMLFFLFEFFSDQLLAFMVLSLVWFSEVFSVVCLRSVFSIRFFPRAFFCYFSMFHVYFFSFPFGFSYLALGTTVLFIQHSMLFCFNSFEISAMESGIISALMPRVGMAAVHVPASDRGDTYNRGDNYHRGDSYNRGESHSRGDSFNRGEASVMQRRREEPVVVINSNIPPRGESLLEGSLVEGSHFEGSQFDHSIEGTHIGNESGDISPVLDEMSQRSVHAAARVFNPSSFSSSSSLLRESVNTSPYRGSFHPITPHHAPPTSTPISNPIPISSPVRSPVSTRNRAITSPHSIRTRSMASPPTSPHPSAVARDTRMRRSRRISGGANYSPLRGPGFPSSSSDTDLMEPTTPPPTTTSIAGGHLNGLNGQSSYQRHFEISRRIQAEQLSVMMQGLGLGSAQGSGPGLASRQGLGLGLVPSSMNIYTAAGTTTTPATTTATTTANGSISTATSINNPATNVHGSPTTTTTTSTATSAASASTSASTSWWKSWSRVLWPITDDSHSRNIDSNSHYNHNSNHNYHHHNNNRNSVHNSNNNNNSNNSSSSNRTHQSTIGSPLRHAVNTVPVMSPSKYDHYQRELVMYGSGDFDLSGALEARARRGSLSTENSP